jgi:hypothetical protein
MIPQKGSRYLPTRLKDGAIKPAATTMAYVFSRASADVSLAAAGQSAASHSPRTAKIPTKVAGNTDINILELVFSNRIPISSLPFQRPHRMVPRPLVHENTLDVHKRQ